MRKIANLFFREQIVTSQLSITCHSTWLVLSNWNLFVTVAYKRSKLGDEKGGNDIFTSTCQENRRGYNIVFSGCFIRLLFERSDLRCHSRGMWFGTKYSSCKNSCQRFSDMKYWCEQTDLVPPVPAVWVVRVLHLTKPILEGDGGLGSSWALLWSQPARRSQGHVLSVDAEMQAIIWVVSEREKAKASRSLVKTWLFQRNFPVLMLCPVGVSALPAFHWESEENKMSN